MKKPKVRHVRASKHCETSKYEAWKFSETSPDKRTIKLMFAEVVNTATKLLMKDHIYKFSDVIKVKGNEGSRGKLSRAAV